MYRFTCTKLKKKWKKEKKCKRKKREEHNMLYILNKHLHIIFKDQHTKDFPGTTNILFFFYTTNTTSKTTHVYILFSKKSRETTRTYELQDF